MGGWSRILSLVGELRFSHAAPGGPKQTDKQDLLGFSCLTVPRHPSLQTVTWGDGAWSSPHVAHELFGAGGWGGGRDRRLQKPPGGGFLVELA